MGGETDENTRGIHEPHEIQLVSILTLLSRFKFSTSICSLIVCFCCLRNNNQSSKKSAHWAIGLPSLASVSPVHTLSGSSFFIPCSVACARQRTWRSMAMISPQALKSPLTPLLASPKLSFTGPFQPQLNWKNRAFQSTKLVNRNILPAPARAVAGASASGFSPDISEKLGDVRIFTAAGEPVLFKDLWDQKEVNDILLYPNFLVKFLLS